MSGASDAHRGIKRMLDAYRASMQRHRALAAIARAEADRDAYLHAEAPSPRHGSTEARLYAVAAEIAREEGKDRLSYYADRFVAFAQEIMREPRDMTNKNLKGARE